MSDMNPDIEDIPDLLESEEPEAGPSRTLERPQIPITLLTGYLGAGKSTLLEYVLTADHGYKIAVCMNDFGDTTDIEAKSLTLSDPETNAQTTSLLSLPNGCLCCSFKDMGIAAIEEMVASQKGVDWVMVELTGVADPGPIAKSFWSNEEMGDLILDGVVCVVDCRNVMKQLGETKNASGEINDCQKQVACADVILLNKTDLVSTAQLKEVESRIRQINPTLRIHHTVKSRIPLDSLFNIRAFSSDSTSLPFLKPTSTSDPQPETNPHEHEHDHSRNHESDHPQNPHYNDITTVLIPLPTLSADQQEKVESFLQILLWESRIPNPNPEDTDTEPKTQGLDILRTKGYFETEDGSEFVIQGVTDIFEIKEVAEHQRRSRSGEEKKVDGKMVFIGRGVGEELKTAFERYVGL